MSMFWALMELDRLHEAAEDTEYSRAKRDFKHCVEFKDIDGSDVRDLVDRLEASGTSYLQYEHKTDNGVTIFHEDFKLTEANFLNKLFKRKSNVDDDVDGLKDATDLTTEFSEASIVDLIKDAYLQGRFDMLPVGRENALTLDIAGVDKGRLAGFFAKLPEFNHEINNSCNIISHEFISDEYDVEVFDSFISMYKIPQTESFEEGMFDEVPTTLGFRTADGSTVGTSIKTVNPMMHKTPQHGGYVVTIVYDTSKKKLRARGDDGEHGEANVAFPNNLRNVEGQQYRVEELIWNGKNYRASGKIVPIGSGNTFESLNKENNNMSELNNFTSVFEELSKLYEADDQAPEGVEGAEANENAADNADALKEAVDATEEPESGDDAVEVLDDEASEPQQVAIKCVKCGAICLCDEAGLEIDEDTDLANVEQPCEFCEETSGYEIVGTVVPYEAAVTDETAETEDIEDQSEDDLEEGIFDKGPKKGSADYNNALMKFNHGIKAATGGDAEHVNGIANWLAQKLESIFGSASVALVDTARKNGEYRTSGACKAYLQTAVHQYEATIKELKKPASFYAIGSIAYRLAQHLAAKQDVTKSDVDDVRAFMSMLNKVDKIEAEKSVYKTQLEQCAKTLTYRMQKYLDNYLSKKRTLEAFDQSVSEEPIEEGIFDNKKRKSADYKNASTDLELAVESAARKVLGQSNKTLFDIAYDMTTLVTRAISDLRAQERKTKNTDGASSARNAREAMGEKILSDYSNAIKQLNGVTNLFKPASVIGQLISKIVSYNTNTSTATVERIDKYDTLLAEISAHESWKKDKLLAKDTMVRFYKDVIGALTADYEELKNKGPAAIFEGVKTPEVDVEDLEEFLDADINLSLDGGQGNDVDVL